MVFSSSDTGPFYMGISERETKQHTQITGKVITRGITKNELIRLMADKVDLSIYKRKPEGEIKKTGNRIVHSLRNFLFRRNLRVGRPSKRFIPSNMGEGLN